MDPFRFSLVFGLASVLIFASDHPSLAQQSSQCLNADGSYISGADCFPVKSTVTVADHFNISYYKTYKVIHFTPPRTGAVDLQLYAVLYQRGTTKPTASNAGIPASGNVRFFQIPLRRVAVEDTTSLTFFEVG